MTIASMVITVALLAGIASAVMTAPVLSAWLVRRRSANLPRNLAERLEEEWLAELAHIGGRVGQLAFALRLFLTRRQTLVDASTTADAAQGQDGAVVVSLDDLFIRPGRRDWELSSLMDFGLLLVPVALAWYTAPARITFLLSSLLWTSLWLLVVHIWSVRVWQATPGQRLVGMRIITVDRGPLRWHHILRRARAILVGVLIAAMGFAIQRVPGIVGNLGEVAFWSFTVFVGLYPRPLRCFDSGTTSVMHIPTVVGVPGQAPDRSTSLTR